MTKIIVAILGLILSLSTAAQGIEEIIVTAQRSEGISAPASFLRRNGDFLLLSVCITNDTREEKARTEEIYKTLKNILADASKARNIEVSLITDDDLVVPLTDDNYRVSLSQGNRPDTSATNISVKTPINDGDKDGQVLMNRLRDFVSKVKAEGRTELEPDGDVQISVVGPGQYRDEIIRIFAADVNKVTSALGNNYRVIVEGIDRPVYWNRVSLLELALFIPYTYVVIPETVSSFSATEY